MADFLFAVPSFIGGAARTLDLLGQYDRYNVSRSSQQADTRAMYNDWHAVGQLLFEQFQVETKKNPARSECVSGVQK